MKALTLSASWTGENETLPDRGVHVPGLVHPELDLARLDLPDRLGHVHRHRPRLRVRHEAAGAQDPAELAELAHDVRRGDDDVALEPAVLELLDVFDAHEVGARGFRLPDPIALGNHQHANRLPGSVGQHDRPAHHLVGVARVDAEPHGDVHGLIELGERGALHQRHGVGDLVLARPIDLGDRGLELLALGRHQSTTSSPMDRAVPAIIFMALSRSDALRSAILISAIFLTCARVTLPDLGPVGLAAPLLDPRLLQQEVRGRRGLGDEGERAIGEDRHHHRNHHPALALRPGVELLHELHDVHAVRTQGRADRRRGRRRAGRALQLHQCLDLLCHRAPRFGGRSARPYLPR